MKFSQESFYGFAVMVALARRESARPALVDEIAGSQDLPRSFVAKILQKLVRGGLVASSRGRQRGYSLAVPPAQITASDILEITEGADFLGRCMFRKQCAGEAACFLHRLGCSIRADLDARLKGVSLADLATRGLAGGAEPARRDLAC